MPALSASMPPHQPSHLINFLYTLDFKSFKCVWTACQFKGCLSDLAAIQKPLRRLSSTSEGLFCIALNSVVLKLFTTVC
eukprot:1812198-Karenia_brevis.AAC.1